MSWRTAVTDTLIALAVVGGISVVIGAVESVSHVGNISNLYIATNSANQAGSRMPSSKA